MGSEMCIRDRDWNEVRIAACDAASWMQTGWAYPKISPAVKRQLCETAMWLAALTRVYEPCRGMMPREIHAKIQSAQVALGVCRVKIAALREHMMHHSQLMCSADDALMETDSDVTGSDGDSGSEEEGGDDDDGDDDGYGDNYEDDDGDSGSAQSSVATGCLLYTSPSPRDLSTSRMPSSA